MSPVPVLRSARLIIVDPAGRLLLFLYHDEHQPPFWATVGGQLVDDEDYRAAATRELEEETGFDATIGPFLRERDEIYAVAGSPQARWIEHYFLVQCASADEPDRTGWTDEERSTIRDWRWWSVDEIRRSSETFLPKWIPQLLEKVLDAEDGKIGG